MEHINKFFRCARFVPINPACLTAGERLPFLMLNTRARSERRGSWLENRYASPNHIYEAADPPINRGSFLSVRAAKHPTPWHFRHSTYHWNLYPKPRARKMQEASMKERGILSLGLAVILFVFGMPRAFAQLDELKNTTPGERASL
jgi:hypothetical protein